MDLKDKSITSCVQTIPDEFFSQYLKPLYERARLSLKEQKPGACLIIDYLINTDLYPFETKSEWIEYFMTSHLDVTRKHIMLLYLKHDFEYYLTREQMICSGDPIFTEIQQISQRISLLPAAFDFTTTIQTIAEGFWAIDNREFSRIWILGDTTLELDTLFKSDIKGLATTIIDSIVIDKKPLLALFLKRIHGFDQLEHSRSSFDHIHCCLLIESGQLAKALDYVRLHANKKNYEKILNLFFEQCAERQVLQDIALLRLSIQEEQIFNNHYVIFDASRSATPLSQMSINKEKPNTNRSKAPKVVAARGLQHSFSDSPSRNTRSRKKKSHG